MVEKNSSLIPRERFAWAANPLVSGLRPFVMETLRDINDVIFNESDIVLQSLLSICSYPVEEIWGENERFIQESSDFVLARQKGAMPFEPSIMYDETKVNRLLLEKIVSNHARRSTTFKNRLPTGIISALFENAPIFESTARLTTSHRHFVEREGHTEMWVREVTTNNSIVMREIDRMTSRNYAEGLHYIHRARKDELVSYGAFLDGSEFPFAWAAYAPIGSEEEKQLADMAGFKVERTIEMARAWNVAWSPKNTMSLLFAFAHTQMQKICRMGGLRDVAAGPLAGITTAINPNLGFTGMAFRGVNFAPIGLKSTNHKFYASKDEVPLYMLTPDIATCVGVDASEISTHENYRESAIPLLPTNVLGVMLDGKKRMPPQGPIYLIR